MVSFVRGRGPRPSSTPPPARRMPTIGGSRPPPPVKRRRRADLEKGRVVTVFGPPGTGIDRVLVALHEESTTPTALTSHMDDIDDLQRTAEVVFLQGVPETPEDVQTLYDRRYVTPAGGTIVRVTCSTAVNPAFEARLAAIERAIIGLSLPYTCVFADDPMVAATNLFNIAALGE